MNDFNVEIIFNENGKTFDNLIYDIVNTFFVGNYINDIYSNNISFNFHIEN